MSTGRKRMMHYPYRRGEPRSKEGRERGWRDKGYSAPVDIWRPRGRHVQIKCNESKQRALSRGVM